MSTRWEETIDTLVEAQRCFDLGVGRGTHPESGAWWIYEQIADWLDDATPIYVHPDMAATWMEVERAYQQEPFRDGDVLVDAGFAVLPDAVPITRWTTDNAREPTEDDPGELVEAQVRALLWGPYTEDDHEGIALIGLGHPNEQPLEALGLDDVVDVLPARARVGWWMPVLRDALLYDRLFDRKDNCQRAFQSFFALMRQFAPVGEQLPRAARRRAEREQRPTEVKIMRLRRPQRRPSGEGPGTVDWSCSWVVESHWRNQAYAGGEHRQILIEAYIKGPEDKPLRDPSRVIELVR